KNRHFRVHQCSPPFVLVRSQPSDLLAFLLVSCWVGSTMLPSIGWQRRSTIPTGLMSRCTATARAGTKPSQIPSANGSTKVKATKALGLPAIYFQGELDGVNPPETSEKVAEKF